MICDDVQNATEHNCSTLPKWIRDVPGYLIYIYDRLGHRPYDRKADRLYDRGTGSNIRSKDVSRSGINRKQMEIVCCHP